MSDYLWLGPFIIIYAVVIIFILGLLIGSFLNVCSKKRFSSPVRKKFHFPKPGDSSWRLRRGMGGREFLRICTDRYGVKGARDEGELETLLCLKAFAVVSEV